MQPMNLCPLRQRLETRPECRAAVGQPIHGGDWGTGQNLATHQPGCLKFGEAAREHGLGDPRDGRRHLSKPGRSLEESADDDAGPPLSQKAEDAREGSIAMHRVARRCLARRAIGTRAARFHMVTIEKLAWGTEE